MPNAPDPVRVDIVARREIRQGRRLLRDICPISDEPNQIVGLGGGALARPCRSPNVGMSMQSAT
jgi:hypothetical protein